MSTQTVLPARPSTAVSPIAQTLRAGCLPLGGVARPAAIARRYTLDSLDQWGVSGEVCQDAAPVASELTVNAERGRRMRAGPDHGVRSRLRSGLQSDHAYKTIWADLVIPS